MGVTAKGWREMNHTIYCEDCRDVIFNGYISDDGYAEICGEYEDGAGECSECGREQCYGCGFEDGLCRDCQEREEEEDE